MRILILIGLLLSIGVVGISYRGTDASLTAKSFSTIENSTPLKVVEIYCELSEKGDFEKLKQYTTATPEEYNLAFDKEVRMYAKSIGKPLPEVSKNKELDTQGVNQEMPPPKSNSNVDKDFPERFIRDALYINDVKNIWVRENEARIRVIFKSKKSERYKGIEDFLLYQINGEWKIFEIRVPGIFSIYGISNESEYRHSEN